MRERLPNIDSEDVQKVPKGCAAGCLTFVGAGVVVGLLGSALGAACSARVPFTESNVSTAVSVGEKQQAEAVMPEYIQNRNREIAVIDWQSEALVGSLRFKHVTSAGEQPNSPLLELFLRLRGRQPETGVSGIRQAAITIPDNKITE